MKHTHKKHIGLKIVVAVSLLIAISSLALSGYVVFKHNEYVSYSDKTIALLKSQIMGNEQFIISVSMIMKSNDDELAERIDEHEHPRGIRI